MSRHLAFAGVLAAAGLFATASAQAEPTAIRLDQLKWSSRPVIVLSDRRDDPRVVRQLSALDKERPALVDRNIKVLHEARPGSALRKQLGVAAHGFAVVLVGKDGSVKKIWLDPVVPQHIFNLIDQMPMRRQEMRG